MIRLGKRFFGGQALARGEELLGDMPAAREIYRGFARLAWPAAMEGMFAMLVAAINLVMVGDLGTDAVAAVGIITQPKMILLCFCRALAVAVTAIVARRKGEGNLSEAEACLKQSLCIAVLFSALACAASVWKLPEILRLAGAKPEYMQMAEAYGFFTIASVGLTNLATTINGALTGIGNTKAMMRANLAGNLVNMALNYLLIYGKCGFPALGLWGAGLATLLGAGVSLLVSLLALFERDCPLRLFRRRGWRMQRYMLRQILQTGGSAFLEQICERTGMFLYSRMVAEFGTTDYATHCICMNLCDIYYCFCDGMSRASTAITGQQLGAGRKDLAVIYARAGRRMGLVLDSIAFSLYFFGRYAWMRTYAKEAEVISVGANLLIVVAVVCFIQTQSMIYAGALRGAGDTKYVAAYSLWDIAILRPILTYVLCFPLGLGIYGAWIALFLDQLTRAVMATRRFRSMRWAEIRI